MTKRAELPQKDADSRFHVEISAAEQRGWRIQRIGWVLLAVVIVAALAGVFGGGPVSHRTAIAEDGDLQVRYEAVERVYRASDLTWQIMPRNGVAVIEIDSLFLAVFTPDSWIPAPERTELVPNGLRLRFTAPSTEKVTVRLQATPRRVGRFTAHTRGNEGKPWTPMMLTVLP